MRQLFDLRVFDRHVCEKSQMSVIIPEFSYVYFQKKSLKYFGFEFRNNSSNFNSCKSRIF